MPAAAVTLAKSREIGEGASEALVETIDVPVTANSTTSSATPANSTTCGTTRRTGN